MKSGIFYKKRIVLIGIVACCVLIALTALATAAPSFSTPVNVSNSTTNSYNPRVKVDALGDSHMVWWEDSGSNDEIYFSDNSSGSWSTPVKLSTNTNQDTYPRLEVESNGISHVAWESYIGGNWEICYANNASGAWSTPANVSSKSGTDQDPRLVLNGAGDAFIVWRGQDGDYDIYYADNTTGAWSTPVKVNENAYNDQQPSLALDGSGVPVVAWSSQAGNYEIYFSQKQGASFIAPVNISNNPNQDYLPRMVIDGAGSAHVCWYDSAYEIRYTNNATGSFPGSSINVSNSGDLDRYPQIATGSDTFARVVWEKRVGSRYQIYYSDNSSGTFSTPIDLSNAPSLNNYIYQNEYDPVEVLVDGEGATHVAWYGSDYEIYYTDDAGGTFCTPVNVSGSTDTETYPNIALDAAGYTHISWQKRTGNYEATYSRYDTAPTISNTNPTSGIVGTQVTISGDEFGTSAFGGKVTFNGVEAGVVSWSRGVVNVTVPAGATTGNIILETYTGSSNPVPFTVKPSISSFTPSSVRKGDTVVIHGQGFGGSQGTAAINGTDTKILSWSKDTIVAEVAPVTTTGDLVVTTASGQVNAGTVTVLPILESMDPQQGHRGDSIRLEGDAFMNAQGSGHVRLNGHDAPVRSWSNDSIDITVPQDAPFGATEVVVVTGYGESNPMVLRVNPKEQPGSGLNWYFAEGCTIDDGYQGVSFDTWLLVFNPNGEESEITVHFLKPDEERVEKQFVVDAFSRLTVHVDEISGCESTSVSMRVEVTNDIGVVCERSMYFDYEGITGGHCSPGSLKTGDSWYLPEGFTGNRSGSDFDTYILACNPGENTAETKVTLSKESGEEKEISLSIPPLSRETLCVDLVPGFEETSFSARVESTNGVGVVCERSIYFDYYEVTGGHNSMGAMTAADSWYLPEGCTIDGFDTYVLVLNPTSQDAVLDFDFIKRDRDVKKLTTTAPAHSRFTVHVNRIDGCGNADVSTVVSSTNGVPVICERTMYFEHDEFVGGHSSIGSTETSGQWTFSEGCTLPGYCTWVLLQNSTDREASVTITCFDTGGELEKVDVTILPDSRVSISLGQIPDLENLSPSFEVVSQNGVPLACERSLYFGSPGMSGGHNSPGLPNQ